MPPLRRHLKKYLSRSQRFWLALSLVLSTGVYAGIRGMLLESAVAALLTVGVLLLLGVLLGLGRRLKRVQVQRDRALLWANSMQSQISERHQDHEFEVEQQVAQRMQALHTEIAGLQARAQLLQEQAHHDDLTGLANRTLLADRFNSAVARAQRSGRLFALVMVDLNHFKAVNDSYGHAAGDAILITIARRLLGAVRACDTVARLGGDEFVLIIESIDEPQEIASIGDKLLDTLTDTVLLESGAQICIGASIGLAVFPEDGVDITTLLRVADQAMYQCKTSRPMSLS